MKAYELYIDEMRSQAFYVMEFLSYPNLTKWMAKHEKSTGFYFIHKNYIRLLDKSYKNFKFSFLYRGSCYADNLQNSTSN